MDEIRILPNLNPYYTGYGTSQGCALILTRLGRRLHRYGFGKVGGR